MHLNGGWGALKTAFVWPLVPCAFDIIFNSLSSAYRTAGKYVRHNSSSMHPLGKRSEVQHLLLYSNITQWCPALFLGSFLSIHCKKSEMTDWQSLIQPLLNMFKHFQGMCENGSNGFCTVMQWLALPPHIKQVLAWLVWGTSCSTFSCSLCSCWSIKVLDGEKYQYISKENNSSVIPFL